jgi:hypothetical protein
MNMLRPSEEIYIKTAERLMEPERCTRHGREYAPLWGCPLCEEEEQIKDTAARASLRARYYRTEYTTLAIHDDNDIGEPTEGSPVVALFWTVYLLALALVGWAIGYKLELWGYPL